MSDFLQFVDRIPTLPNRKKLTFDDLSVKYAKIEYADEPIEEGTFLNKANFNKLNAVLGYNKDISVEKVFDSFEQRIFSMQANYDSTRVQLTDTKTNIGNFVAEGKVITISAVNNKDITTEIIKSNAQSSGRGFLTFYNSTISTSQCGYIMSSSTPDVTLYFSSPIYIKSFVAQGGNRSNSEIDITLYSNNEIVHTENVIGTNKNIILSDYLLIDSMNIKGINSYSNNIIMCLNDTKIDIEKFKNVFILNSYINFVDNQRVLIETPNFDAEFVEKNTLNGIDIPLTLKPSMKYELIYDEANNSFYIGNAGHVIFDITLDEAVSEIITNIQLKKNTLYRVFVSGGMDTSGNISFLNSNSIALNTMYVNSSETCSSSEFIICDDYVSCFYKNSSNDIQHYGNKNIGHFTTISKISQSQGYTILSNTRIIIMEVA